MTQNIASHSRIPPSSLLSKSLLVLTRLVRSGCVLLIQAAMESGREPRWGRYAMECDGVFVGQRRYVFRASTVYQTALVSWEASPFASVLKESANGQCRYSRWWSTTVRLQCLKDVYSADSGALEVTRPVSWNNLSSSPPGWGLCDRPTTCSHKKSQVTSTH
jgi:hypothetical protein